MFYLQSLVIICCGFLYMSYTFHCLLSVCCHNDSKKTLPWLPVASHLTLNYLSVSSLTLLLSEEENVTSALCQL